MDHRDIILAAWRLVTDHGTLKRFNFFPSLVTTIYLAVIVLYQIAFAYLYIFEIHVDIFQQAMNILQSDYIWWIVIGVTVALIVYILTIPIADAGLIALIDRMSRASADSRASSDLHPYSYGISRGILFFRPIFEFNNLMISFKILSIITFFLLFVRLIGVQYVSTTATVFGIYLCFAFIVNILFAYTRLFMVLDAKPPLEAIGASIGMTFDHLTETIGFYFTVLLLYIRTLFSAAILILAPFAISATLTYIVSDYIRIVGVVILCLIFLVFLVLVSHLNSVLEIFTQAIWYHAYRAFKEEKEKEGGDKEKDE